MHSIAKLALIVLAAGATFCASAQPSDMDRRARNREDAIARHRNIAPPVPQVKPHHHRAPVRHHGRKRGHRPPAHR